MKLSFDLRRATHWRLAIQWLFLAWCLWLGVQFSLFVRHFETLGRTGYFPRPPAVEGFLPIGALVSLKGWFVSGEIDPVHPAALVLFLTFLLLAFLTRKSFCSFLCPVGTLSEGAWRLGRRLFGRNFRIWRGLDLLLQGVKYALLLFFAKAVLFDMPAAAVQAFLASPYWAVADVRMLHFFTAMSRVSLAVILTLTVMSLFYRNAWCRYFCPYGALLGLFSTFSPLRIRREAARCTGCGACSRVCPSHIDVQKKTVMLSPECTGCLTCVSGCPAPGALAIAVWRRPIPPRVFIALVMLLFTAGVLGGMLSGHWQTSLGYEDYRQLVPLAGRLGH